MKSNPEKIIMVFEMEDWSHIWSGKEEFQRICYAIDNGIIYKESEYIDLKNGRGLFIAYWPNGKKSQEYYFKWPAISWPSNIEGEFKVWNKNSSLTDFRYYINKYDNKYKDVEKHSYNDDLCYIDIVKHPEYIKQYNLDIRF